MDMVITRLFDTYEHATEAVAGLEASGVPHKAISLIASNADNRHGGGTAPIEEAEPADAVADSAGTGASVGTVLGGGAGLLAGLGMSTKAPQLTLPAAALASARRRRLRRSSQACRNTEPATPLPHG